MNNAWTRREEDDLYSSFSEDMLRSSLLKRHVDVKTHWCQIMDFYLQASLGLRIIICKFEFCELESLSPLLWFWLVYTFAAIWNLDVNTLFVIFWGMVSSVWPGQYAFIDFLFINIITPPVMWIIVARVYTPAHTKMRRDWENTGGGGGGGGFSHKLMRCDWNTMIEY